MDFSNLLPDEITRQKVWDGMVCGGCMLGLGRKIYTTRVFSACRTFKHMDSGQFVVRNAQNFIKGFYIVRHIIITASYLSCILIQLQFL